MPPPDGRVTARMEEPAVVHSFYHRRSSVQFSAEGPQTARPPLFNGRFCTLVRWKPPSGHNGRPRREVGGEGRSGPILTLLGAPTFAALPLLFGFSG